MEMIIGGAWQGKLAFAKEIHPEIVNELWVNGESCDREEIFCCKGIYDFHRYLRKIAEQHSIDPESFVKELFEKNPDLIVVTDEIGCGIVPMDRFERAYRELTGRVCTKLAEKSEKVYRVQCGIGNKIKG